MKVAVLLAVLLNWLRLVLGPLTIDQTSVPTVGLFAPKVAPSPSQMVCGPPALDMVGSGLTVIVTSEVEGVQGSFDMVHRKT